MKVTESRTNPATINEARTNGMNAKNPKNANKLRRIERDSVSEAPAPDPLAAQERALPVYREWMSKTPEELAKMLLTENQDGSYSANFEGMEVFRSLPPEMAADIVAKLVQPGQSQTGAYYSVLLLSQFVDAAGETPNFQAIFTDETLSAAAKLFDENAEFFQGLENISTVDGDGVTRLALIGDPIREVSIETTETDPEKALVDAMLREKRAYDMATSPMGEVARRYVRFDEPNYQFPEIQNMSEEQIRTHAAELIAETKARHARFGEIGAMFADKATAAQRSSTVLADREAANAAENSSEAGSTTPAPRSESRGEATTDTTATDGSGWTPYQGDTSNLSFNQLRKHLVMMLMETEKSRENLMGQLLKTEDEPNQATLTAFKADMDAVQGRLDILTEVLKDAADYQKNLSRKIMA